MMSIVTFNNKKYELENLSKEAKNQFNNLKFVDAEIARMNAQIAVFQTARNAYLAALQGLLPKEKVN